MSTNDGGHAFSRNGRVGIYSGDKTIQEPEQGSPGMSLRDWFAGQALAGRVLHRMALDKEAISDDALAEYIAKAMYRLADAMLAERERDL